MSTLNNTMEAISAAVKSFRDQQISQTYVAAKNVSPVMDGLEGYEPEFDDIIATIDYVRQSDLNAGLSESQVSQYSYIGNYSTSSAEDYRLVQLKSNLSDNYKTVSSHNPVKQLQFEYFSTIVKMNDPAYLNSLTEGEKHDFAKDVNDLRTHQIATGNLSDDMNSIIVGYSPICADSTLITISDTERDAMAYNTYKAFKEWCDKANPTLEAKDAVISNCFGDFAKFETMLSIENGQFNHIESVYNAPEGSYNANLLSVINAAKTIDKDVSISTGKQWKDAMHDMYLRELNINPELVGLSDIQQQGFLRLQHSDAEKYRMQCLKENYTGDYLKGIEPSNEFEKTCFDNLEQLIKTVDIGYIDAQSDSSYGYDVAKTAACGLWSMDGLSSVGGILDPRELPDDERAEYEKATYEAATKWVKANMEDISRLPEVIQDSLFEDIDIASIRKEYELSIGEGPVMTVAKPTLADAMSAAHSEAVDIVKNANNSTVNANFVHHTNDCYIRELPDVSVQDDLDDSLGI